MEYVITFLSGISTFISPCLLPMLPLYITYFAGGEAGDKKSRTIINALGFIVGFTLVFVLLGVFAGSVGRLLRQHQTLVNWVTGGVVTLFGLHFLGVLKIGFLDRTKGMQANVKNLHFFSSADFGIAFSISWTPCVGVYLGAALMMASQQGQVLQGVLLLLCYSLGLGVPLFLSALLIDQLKGAFQVIKRNYQIINKVSGILLVIMGLLMITGRLNQLLALFS